MPSQVISHTVTYMRPSLEVDYDYVGIVDGLTSADRLKYEITEELTELLVSAGVQVAIARVNNKAELFASLEQFRKEAVEGKKFMLHFVAHGNENGIQAATEFCQWNELQPFLQRVHTATNETLLLNMSTCKGLHGIKATDRSGPFPCFGLIGATTDLLVEDAKAANRKVYEKWLAGIPVQRLVPETNHELGKELLYNISSEGYRILSEAMQ
jgi:hypothetical protein